MYMYIYGTQMNETLCVLDLSWNGIADDGAHILSGVLLYNNTLHELDVSSNRISQEGCFCFAQALLKNNALRILKVSTLRIPYRNARPNKYGAAFQ